MSDITKEIWSAIQKNTLLIDSTRENYNRLYQRREELYVSLNCEHNFVAEPGYIDGADLCTICGWLHVY